MLSPVFKSAAARAIIEEERKTPVKHTIFIITITIITTITITTLTITITRCRSSQKHARSR